jgi:hypothetical protein
MSSQKNRGGFTPRKGQQELIEYLPNISKGDLLNIQWPTGYGKSIGMALAWKHCWEAGIANRFLIVVANDIQREQVKQDFESECGIVGAPCCGGVWEFDRDASTQRASKKRESTIFVCTVHQMHASVGESKDGYNALSDLLKRNGTQWMIAFDEYQHYGTGMAWGDSAEIAMKHSSFNMAMSATPYRRGASTVFGEPELVVSYANAAESNEVKRMICESYGYKVTVLREGHDPKDYTTEELLQADFFDRTGLSAWEEKNEIRFSPQYIHPLIMEPMERLRNKIVSSGQNLQMLVRAMSCLHAETVCKQIESLAGGLSVDWIGTGPNGKSNRENRKIVRKFCPKKRNGKRPQPDLDIMVQVSMAGEGFDSVNVCEIVDLFPVSKETLKGLGTADKQFYGRGSRFIEGIDLHVSVPTDHPLAAFARCTLHEWMDHSGIEDIKSGNPVEPKGGDLFYFPDLPESREIELTEINRESEVYKRVVPELARRRLYDLENPSDLAELEQVYLGVEKRIAEKQSAQAQHARLRKSVDQIVGRLALVKAKQTEELNGAVLGRYKKQVNAALIKRYGKTREEMSSNELEVAFQWLRQSLMTLRPGDESN